MVGIGVYAIRLQFRSKLLSTVPAQALYFRNSPFVIVQARHAAKKLLAQTADDDERIRRAFQLCYAREPDRAELAAARGFIDGANGEEEKAVLSVWGSFLQALFASAEFRYLASSTAAQ